MKFPTIPGKLWTLLIASTTSSLVSGLKVSMFGDGSLTWPQFNFSWTQFVLGIASGIAVVVHGYYSTPPIDTGKPV